MFLHTVLGFESIAPCGLASKHVHTKCSRSPRLVSKNTSAQRSWFFQWKRARRERVLSRPSPYEPAWDNSLSLRCASDMILEILEVLWEGGGGVGVV